MQEVGQLTALAGNHGPELSRRPRLFRPPRRRPNGRPNRRGGGGRLGGRADAATARKPRRAGRAVCGGAERKTGRRVHLAAIVFSFLGQPSTPTKIAADDLPDSFLAAAAGVLIEASRGN